MMSSKHALSSSENTVLSYVQRNIELPIDLTLLCLNFDCSFRFNRIIRRIFCISSLLRPLKNINFWGSDLLITFMLSFNWTKLNVFRRLEGWSRDAVVAAYFIVSRITITRLAGQYRIGGSVNHHLRSGRPRVTTAAQDRHIRTLHLRNHFYWLPQQLQRRPVVPITRLVHTQYGDGKPSTVSKQDVPTTAWSWLQ